MLYTHYYRLCIIPGLMREKAKHIAFPLELNEIPLSALQALTSISNWNRDGAGRFQYWL